MSVNSMFLRDKNGFPIGCLAIQVLTTFGEIHYNFSVHNPKDEFNRARAHEVAIKRLMKKPIVVPLRDGAHHNDIIFAVMSDMQKSDNMLKETMKQLRKAGKEVEAMEVAKQLMPTRASKAVNLWLDARV
jgi:hypothetical protein